MASAGPGKAAASPTGAAPLKATRLSYSNIAANKSYAAASKKVAESPSAAAAPTFAAAAASAAAAEVKSSSSGADEALTSKDYYFDSYSHFGIHEEMLKDEVRTKNYMNAIMLNPHLFRGKTVLDVGCGTGILCMFAAKAGATRVIGVECAGIITQARQIIHDNGFDGVVTLVKGKIEEVELPVDKVDIIISEWMGYFLLYESMLDSVIYARDKWLAKDGLIFPDKASLFLCAIEDAEYRQDKIDFWDNVYGFDMRCIKKLAILEPLVDTCDGNQVISNSCKVLEVDLYTCTKESLDFEANYKVTFNADDHCHALVGYFSVEFSKTNGRRYFSTGPHDRYTHWKQSVFYFHEALPVHHADTLSGTVKVSRHDGNPRDLDIHISHQLKVNKTGEKTAPISQFYRLR